MTMMLVLPIPAIPFGDVNTTLLFVTILTYVLVIYVVKTTVATTPLSAVMIITLVLDSCDPYLGCLNVKISCDDGDACTIDRCNCDEGCEHFPVDPKDNEACAEWTPHQCTGDEECEDGSQCTVNTCKSGSCHTVAVDCDDDDICTVDSCDPKEGCTYYALFDGPCGDKEETELHMKGEEEKESVELQSAEISDNDSLRPPDLKDSPIKRLSPAEISGIVVGAVAFVAIVAVIGYKVVSRKPNAVSIDNAYTSM